jgi:hypothetical protein
MIRSAEEILAGYPFFARRHSLSGEYDARVVRAAVDEARAMAVDVCDEPASLFFAFARRPRAFAGGWPRIVEALACNHALALGLQPIATTAELRTLAGSVARREKSFEDVREFFKLRLVPCS